MRILFWSETFWPHIGGQEVLTSHLVPAMQERGHDLLVVTSHLSPHTPRQSTYHGSPIHRFPFQTALLHRDLAAIQTIRRDLLRLKRDFSPQLVHLHFSGPSDFFHLRTLAPDHPPTLLTVHAPLSLVPSQNLPKVRNLREVAPQDAQANSLHRDVLGTAAWVVGVSQALLADLVAFAPEIASRASVIYNGLPAPSLPPTSLPWHPPRLLCLGRVVHAKGFDLALHALPTVLARHPRARLVIAGDGAVRADLAALAHALGVSHAVEFTGWVPPDQVPALLNTATVVVMPSRWREPFGLVSLQAGQMARPVVATRVGGLPEVVVDGETGLLVDNEDAGGLARAILHLLDHPTEAARLGQAGRQRAQTLFSFDGCVDLYDALYRQLGQP